MTLSVPPWPPTWENNLRKDQKGGRDTPVNRTRTWMVDLNKLVESRPLTLLPAAAGKKAAGREQVRKAKDTAGPAWFNMPATEITPEIEKDLRLVRMRSALDPKRHYKGGPILTSKYFQMGTVVAGADERYSAGRLTKRQQGSTILDTLLKDDEKRSYFKKKFNASQTQNRAGGKLEYERRQKALKKPWKR